MPITVLIPTPLREKLGGHESLSVDAASVRELLSKLTTQYPGVEKMLFKSPGVVNQFIGLYVNDEDVKFLKNLDTALSSRDELTIITAIGGG